MVFVYSLVGIGVSYLVGSIPFGLLVAKWAKGIDIREHGSGNIGATNVGRTLGFRWFLAVFALDYLKGLLPTLLIPLVVESLHGTVWVHLAVLCGFATLVGHMYPLYLKFKGGKGVATGLGMVTVLMPIGSGVALLTFLTTFGLVRIISAASMLGAIAFCIAEMILLKPHPFTAENWPLATLAILAPLLIIVRHRSNIARLLKGEEQKIQASQKEQPSQEPTEQVAQD